MTFEGIVFLTATESTHSSSSDLSILPLLFLFHLVRPHHRHTAIARLMASSLQINCKRQVFQKLQEIRSVRPESTPPFPQSSTSLLIDPTHPTDPSLYHSLSSHRSPSAKLRPVTGESASQFLERYIISRPAGYRVVVSAYLIIRR